MGVAGFVGISDDRTKHELAQYLLGPLDHEPELLHTLSTFFAANCSPSATASDLAIHRNTLSYRLDKIAALTGLDPGVLTTRSKSGWPSAHSLRSDSRNSIASL